VGLTSKLTISQGKVIRLFYRIMRMLRRTFIRSVETGKKIIFM